MSVFCIPSLGDRAAARRMCVFTNPLKTERRYGVGLWAAAGSLRRLDIAVQASDWQAVASALGDIGACLGIDSADKPSGDPDVLAVAFLMPLLKFAFKFKHEHHVRSFVKMMLNRMTLI